MKEHNDLILELPNFLPESLCKRLIDNFEKYPDKKTGVVSYDGVTSIIPELKNSTEVCTCCTHGFENEHKECKKYLDQAIRLYQLCLEKEYDYKQVKHTFETIIDEDILNYNYPTVIQKQTKGSKYAWHFDGGFDCKDFILMIVYLNTLEPYEGGCTEFGHGRKIRPECGKIMICPASWTYPHCGNEVKGDAKYILTGRVNMLI